MIFTGDARYLTTQTAEFLVLKWYLSYPNVKLYEGSFMEWAGDSQNPAVTGPDPYGRPKQAGNR